MVRPQGEGADILRARAVNDSQRTAIGNQTEGRVSFFLQTDAFFRDHTAYLTAEIKFQEPPRIEPYGKAAVFRDPFGNWWDLLETKS